MKSTNMMDNTYPGPSPFRSFEFFTVLIKLELSIIFINALFWSIQNQNHSPHLKVLSPHVASGEWVGQRWVRANQNSKYSN